jgi:6,7-dimethyl-8-ribityllumazine synthase
MKKLFTITLLLIGMMGTAQFDRKTVQTKLSLFTSPGSFEDGFSIGMQLNANFDFGGFVRVGLVIN